MMDTTQNLPDVLYRGSVKNVRGTKGGQDYFFEFSDRYSVFDWGEMPDLLPAKGEALAHMTHLLFAFLQKRETWMEWPFPLPKELPRPAFLSSFPHIWEQVLGDLRMMGACHHGQGLVKADGSSLNKISGTRSRLLKVKAVQVDPPILNETKSGQGLSWNYDKYKEKRTQLLVPLEVIFRFGAPLGSSLKKRVHSEDYRRELGLDGVPQEGDFFSRPVLEFSTKLESTDRYVSYAEAKDLAGLTDGEFARLYALTTLLAMRLRDLFQEMGIELWDGKLEFAFASASHQGERDFILVDAIGPDELRLVKEGMPLSKEILRQFYHRTPWYEAAEQAKELAKKRGTEEWQALCRQELQQDPPHLPGELKELAGRIYQLICDSLSVRVQGTTLFLQDSSQLPGAWDKLMRDLKKFH